MSCGWRHTHWLLLVGAHCSWPSPHRSTCLVMQSIRVQLSVGPSGCELPVAFRAVVYQGGDGGTGGQQEMGAILIQSGA